MTLPKILEGLDNEHVDALLMELGERNTVRVVKHTVSSRPGQRRFLRKVLDERFQTELRLGALLRLDEMRVLHGLKPRYLLEALRLTGGELVGVTGNLRTNVGIDFVVDSLGKSSGRPAAADYMALTESAASPAAGDTTLPAEITTNGLQRAQSTYAHTGSATTYTLAHTFTATGSFATVRRDALFNAASVGTLFVTATITSTALVTSDQLTVTHSITV